MPEGKKTLIKWLKEARNRGKHLMQYLGFLPYFGHLGKLGTTGSSFGGWELEENEIKGYNQCMFSKRYKARERILTVVDIEARGQS